MSTCTHCNGTGYEWGHEYGQDIVYDYCSYCVYDAKCPWCGIYVQKWINSTAPLDGDPIGERMACENCGWYQLENGHDIHRGSTPHPDDDPDNDGSYIRNLQDLCDYFYAEEPSMLNKRIYKGTDCGASISVYLGGDVAIHPGDPAWNTLAPETDIRAFTIQTIVEGSDAEVNSNLFQLPVKCSEVNKWIEYMEMEAEFLWKEANLQEDEQWDGI